MSANRSLEFIVSATYDAAINASDRQSMLSGIADGIKADAVLIHSNSNDTDNSYSSAHPDDIGLYDKTLKELNFLLKNATTVVADNTFSILLGAGAQPGTFVMIVKPADETQNAIVCIRKSDAFGLANAELLRNLVPHIFRSLRLTHLLEEKIAKGRSALALLNLLATPVFLIDAEFRVILSNNAARKFNKDGIFALRDDRLFFESSDARAKANAAIATITDSAPEHTTECMIRLQRPDGTLVLGIVQSLSGLFASGEGAPEQAVAAIFLKDPERRLRSTEMILQELHGMSSAEATCAASLAEGMTIKEYASKSDLSEGYVRHLSKRVMQRLGVNRQPDLVRMVIRICPELGM